MTYIVSPLISASQCLYCTSHASILLASLQCHLFTPLSLMHVACTPHPCSMYICAAQLQSCIHSARFSNSTAPHSAPNRLATGMGSVSLFLFSLLFFPCFPFPSPCIGCLVRLPRLPFTWSSAPWLRVGDRLCVCCRKPSSFATITASHCQSS